jgi:hypothetical protein
VAALAENGDAQRIGVRRITAFDDADLPGGKVVHDVQRQQHIRLREAREQSVLNHLFGPADRLFGGLPDENQRSMPRIPPLRHDGGRRDERAHVQVVPAHMPDRDVATCRILSVYLARERQSGRLFDGQRVELRPQQHRLAGTVAKHGDDPSPADVLGYRVAEGA